MRVSRREGWSLDSLQGSGQVVGRSGRSRTGACGAGHRGVPAPQARSLAADEDPERHQDQVVAQLDGRLRSLYRGCGRRPPVALQDWRSRLGEIRRQYEQSAAGAVIVEAQREGWVHLFDLAAQAERLVCSYGLSMAGAADGLLDDGPFPLALHQEQTAEGERFRRMERYAVGRPGTFFYLRPVYSGSGSVPDQLECGVLRADREWWIERFGGPSAPGA